MKTSGWIQALALTAPVVAAIGVAWFTTRSAARIARDDRVGERRADAYTMLGEHAVPMRQYSLIANPDLGSGHPLMPPPLSEEDRYRMFALVETYGTSSAREACDELLVSSAKVRNAVAHLGDMKALSPPFTADLQAARSQALDRVGATKQDLGDCCQRTLDLLNSEMVHGR